MASSNIILNVSAPVTVPTPTPAPPSPPKAAPTPPAAPHAAKPGDWRAGLPAVLVAIAWCESRDEPTVVNASSGDGGLFQFDPGTWADFDGYARAEYAPPAVQAQAALQLYQHRGIEPWRASEGCWG